MHKYEFSLKLYYFCKKNNNFIFQLKTKKGKINVARYCWSRESTFDFIREEVMKCCNELETIEEQIRYLSFVLLEKQNNPPELDENIGLKPTFEDFMHNEIKYRKLMLKLGDKQTQGLIKITGKIPEVVRIFEAMKDAEIISLKTESAQIGRIFFSEKLEVKNFASTYNARKKDLIEEERSTSSEPLLKFINNLIEISYKSKPEFLDNITNHIEGIRKKSYIR